MKAFVLAMVVLAGNSMATTYEVGPGKKFAGLGQVPWESLQPGDTVLIHPRSEPYRSCFVICRAGTADAPITVRGVPAADGTLPVINADGATARKGLDYWGGERSVIKIGGAKNPPDTTPAYIVIENLDVCGARGPNQFRDGAGKVNQFRKDAAAIRIEKGEHITIRNCRLHDCGNGLFVSSNDREVSRDILIEGNHIFGNGVAGSGYEHNAYSEAIGIVYQYNWFGPLREKSPGINLKDRSAGLVVRGNWFEGGDKALDLVDAEDSALVRADAGYREAFVCGNTFLKLPAARHAELVHCGGDSRHTEQYRRGLLHFYNNTIVTYRSGTTLIFRFSSNAERCDFRSNLVFAADPKGKVTVVENAGEVELTRNWFSAGWRKAESVRSVARFGGDGIALTGTDPGFVDLAGQDFHLRAGSRCLGAGVSLGVERQYVKHQQSEPRPDGARPDIGAYSSPRSASSSSSSPK